MLRRLTGLTAAVFILVAASLVAAQELTKKETQAPVTDTAVQGKAPGEATEAPAKNEMTPPIETRRGAYSCDIAIDNRTSWIIHRIYIDNAYWGSVGRHGDGIARDVSTGRTKVYAEADFTNGSTMRWGPQWFDCRSYSLFTWTLRP
jgi:hypothetical protein